MISDSIVILSVVMVAAFWMSWLMRRDMRERIERPKHEFQDRVQKFDRQLHYSGTRADRGHAQE